MTTLNKKIIKILKDSGSKNWDRWVKKAERDNYWEFLADLILKTVHENPSIKKGRKLLKEKRENDNRWRKWRKNVKNK